jgi:hypothetical protein
VNIIVGQDQKFWMTDAGKWHFKAQYIQHNYMLFIWASYRDWRKWKILAWKQCIWERQIDVSLHCITNLEAKCCARYLDL